MQLVQLFCQMQRKLSSNINRQSLITKAFNASQKKGDIDNCITERELKFISTIMTRGEQETTKQKRLRSGKLEKYVLDMLSVGLFDLHAVDDENIRSEFPRRLCTAFVG